MEFPGVSLPREEQGTTQCPRVGQERTRLPSQLAWAEKGLSPGPVSPDPPELAVTVSGGAARLPGDGAVLIDSLPATEI